MKHGLVFDSNAAIEEFRSRGKRKRMNKSARAREKRRLLELQRKEEDTSVSSDIANLKSDTDASTQPKPITDGKGESKETSNCDKSDEGGGDALSVSHFDHVLVDAECSTDGAIRHIEKRNSSSSPRNPAWDDTNMDELVHLQERLIESGFRLLKRGGTMVYSTCSLSPKQNEQVVHWLLDKYEDAFIKP
ncbi:hypothetical protein ACHAXR_000145, partial [Thalassiosira sp. AJA248-18]